MATVKVGGADHFGVYPDENDEQEEIHLGKHNYFCQKLSGSGTGSNSLYPLSLLKLVVLIYFSLL